MEQSIVYRKLQYKPVAFILHIPIIALIPIKIHISNPVAQ